MLEGAALRNRVLLGGVAPAGHSEPTNWDEPPDEQSLISGRCRWLGLMLGMAAFTGGFRTLFARCWPSGVLADSRSAAAR